MEVVTASGSEQAQPARARAVNTERVPDAGVTPGRTGGPSQLFIMRPVATTLLMVAILLAGIIGYRFLPVSALPEVDYPTIQVVTLSGRQPGCGDLRYHRPAGAPSSARCPALSRCRRKAWRRLGSHAAVPADPAAGRRRAGSAGGH